MFEHVKNELPKLHKELEAALKESQKQLTDLGLNRSASGQCRTYLARLSQEFWTICKDAINGHFENEYFSQNVDNTFDVNSASTIRRTRAIVQELNRRFAGKHEMTGHKYNIEDEGDAVGDAAAKNDDEGTPRSLTPPEDSLVPYDLSRDEALQWVRQVLLRNRGKGLLGNFNPLLIGELLREQASNWAHMAGEHIDLVSSICTRFLQDLLEEKCVADIEGRLWSTHFEAALKIRTENAYVELAKIIKEVRSHPINYNHYYTETVSKRHDARLRHRSWTVLRRQQNASLTKTNTMSRKWWNYSPPNTKLIWKIGHAARHLTVFSQSTRYVISHIASLQHKLTYSYRFRRRSSWQTSQLRLSNVIS